MTSNAPLTHYQQMRDLRHAQGLLELVSCCDDRWGIDNRLKRKTAVRVLKILKNCRPNGRKRAVWYSLRGRALLIIGKARLASRSFRAAIKVDPEHMPAYLALAWCFKRCGRIDQSIIALSRAVDRSPDNAMVRYNLACYLSLAGQPEQATLELAIAIDLKPELNDRVADEKDFDPIRHHPAFDALAQGVHPF